MPLNEAYGFHRSNLTKEQKRAAEAAVYGQSVPTMPPNQPTPEQVELMRTLVAQHDSHAAVKEFDLNNPKTEPYVFQPFPTTVYRHDTHQNKLVNDPGELLAALDEGWKNEPPPTGETRKMPYGPLHPEARPGVELEAEYQQRISEYRQRLSELEAEYRERSSAREDPVEPAVEPAVDKELKKTKR